MGTNTEDPKQITALNEIAASLQVIAAQLTRFNDDNEARSKAPTSVVGTVRTIS